jgi:MFS family permease
MDTEATALTKREPLFTTRFWLSCATHFTGAMALAFYILFPLFIRSLGGTELTIGAYAGIAGAAAVLARWPVGRLLDSHGSVSRFFLSYSFTAVAVRILGGRLPDRVGLQRVLFPALLVFAGGIFAIPHAGPQALILVGAACGAGHGYVFPILTVLTAERVAPGQRGRAVTWFTVMFDLGTTLASPAFGAVAEWQGYAAMFTLAGTAMLAGVAMMWREALPR